MKKILLLFLTLITLNVSAQSIKRDLTPDEGENNLLNVDLKKVFKFATFYGALNGGTSLSNQDIYSVTNGLETNIIETPYDYSVTLGIRKIARMGYEPKEAFKNGQENSFSDASTIGKVSGFEFLFELDYKRQEGIEYTDQHHFLRYIDDKYIYKGEYLEDGFADIKYVETSERLRYKVDLNNVKDINIPEVLKGGEFSFNIGAAQRLSEPYGYDPLAEWLLSNGNLHYTQLAIEEGYEVRFDGHGGFEYLDPSGNQVATNTEVWEAVVIPTVLDDYSNKKRNELENTIQHSLIVGFDYYLYTKKLWVHSWGNLMPWHYDAGDEFSYHKYNGGEQWYDYSGGLIFGLKLNKHLGVFAEGKYNKYWNREWHDFSVGVNYIIF